MPSETTYWIIIIAALSAALALWLLTRSAPAKPKKRKPRAAAVAPTAKKADYVPASEPVVELPVAELPAKTRATTKPRGAAKPKAKAGPPDALTRLKGLGAKAATRLNALGVTRFDQIAAWSDEDVARIAPELGNLRDRIVRDRWVEQAGHLASGDTTGFEAKFGKLG